MDIAYIGHLIFFIITYVLEAVKIQHFLHDI